METWGALQDGRDVHRLVLGREPGVVVHLLTLGGTVHRVEVTGGDGTRRNLALGHADPAAYLASGDYIGGSIGRYANRIARGEAELDGRTLSLGTHDRGHHLHGGPDGFDRRLWAVAEHSPDHAVLTLTSPDGDQGFPGTLEVRVTWRVEGERVSIDFEAVPDAATLVNLTCHAYLNLDGEGSGTVDGHLLQVAADDFTPVDDTGIPTGGHAPVAGTPFDLREPTLLGPVLRVAHPQLEDAQGIDHNFVLHPAARSATSPAAVLVSPRTGTRLELRTDQPGLQVYTGNFLDGTRRSATGGLYRQGDGIALEPQLFPDSPHHPGWPQARVGAGETYRSSMSWTFSRVPPG